MCDLACCFADTHTQFIVDNKHHLVRRTLAKVFFDDVLLLRTCVTQVQHLRSLRTCDTMRQFTAHLWRLPKEKCNYRNNSDLYNKYKRSHTRWGQCNAVRVVRIYASVSFRPKTSEWRVLVQTEVFSSKKSVFSHKILLIIYYSDYLLTKLFSEQ